MFSRFALGLSQASQARHAIFGPSAPRGTLAALAFVATLPRLAALDSRQASQARHGLSLASSANVPRSSAKSRKLDLTSSLGGGSLPQAAPPPRVGVVQSHGL